MSFENYFGTFEIICLVFGFLVIRSPLLLFGNVHWVQKPKKIHFLFGFYPFILVQNHLERSLGGLQMPLAAFGLQTKSVFGSLRLLYWGWGPGSFNLSDQAHFHQPNDN